MPLTAILKQLRMKMATLQSPRTQCCCCAVGVFAAMFGFLMLSAGICIVLNVNFMEVDTSGLPPELHNEDGKRVVGIILICLALGFLGLSVTVSVVYFVFCNRKPEENRSKQSQQQQQNGHHRQNGQPMYDSSTNNLMLANGRYRPRPGSKDSAKNGQGSSQSLNNRRIPTPDGPVSTISLTPLPGGAPKNSRGVPSTSGYRNHSSAVHHHRKHHKKQRGLRPSKLRSSLPTHTEEDPESARSVPDLDGAVTQISRSKFYIESSATPERKLTPPKIVIDDSLALTSSPNCTVTTVEEGVSETSLMDDTTQIDNFGELTLDLTPDPHYGLPSENATDVSENFTDSKLTSDFDLDSTITSASALVSHAQHEDPVRGDKHVSDTMSLTNSQTDSADDKQGTLNDRISFGSHSDSPQPPQARKDSLSSTSHTSSRASSRQSQHQQTHHVIHQNTQPPLFEQVPTAEDRISQLPSKSKQSGVRDPELRSESMSSFNSAFSYDGEDPDKSDMERLREKMTELIE